MKAADDEAASSIAATEKTTNRSTQEASLRRAHEVAAAVHLVSSPGTLAADASRLFQAAKKARSPWFKKDVTERALAMAVRIPSALPHVNKAFHTAFMNDTTEAFGTPTEVLTLDCLFKQHAMEFAVEAFKWKALFDEVQHLIKANNLFVHFPVEVRFVDAEWSWLAPNSFQKSCFIGVVMFRPKGLDSPHWRKYYSLFEEAATKLGGRPHWAKSYSWRKPQFDAAYPYMPAFVALQRLMDPNGIFVNDWFRQIITA